MHNQGYCDVSKSDGNVSFVCYCRDQEYVDLYVQSPTDFPNYLSNIKI
jgi:hypothetical protein